MKRLALVVGSSMLVTGVGALVSSSSAASQPAPRQPATIMCGGYPVNVVVSSTGVFLGTPGDDYVVVQDGMPFYGGGGTDTVCNAQGEIMAIVLNDDEGPTVPPADPNPIPVPGS